MWSQTWAASAGLPVRFQRSRPTLPQRRPHIALEPPEIAGRLARPYRYKQSCLFLWESLHRARPNDNGARRRYNPQFSWPRVPGQDLHEESSASRPASALPSPASQPLCAPSTTLSDAPFTSKALLAELCLCRKWPCGIAKSRSYPILPPNLLTDGDPVLRGRQPRLPPASKNVRAPSCHR